MAIGLGSMAATLAAGLSAAWHCGHESAEGQDRPGGG